MPDVIEEASENNFPGKSNSSVISIFADENQETEISRVNDSRTEVADKVVSSELIYHAENLLKLADEKLCEIEFDMNIEMIANESRSQMLNITENISKITADNSDDELLHVKSMVDSYMNQHQLQLKNDNVSMNLNQKPDHKESKKKLKTKKNKNSQANINFVKEKQRNKPSEQKIKKEKSLVSNKQIHITKSDKTVPVNKHVQVKIDFENIRPPVLSQQKIEITDTHSIKNISTDNNITLPSENKINLELNTINENVAKFNKNSNVGLFEIEKSGCTQISTKFKLSMQSLPSLHIRRELTVQKIPHFEIVPSPSDANSPSVDKNVVVIQYAHSSMSKQKNKAQQLNEEQNENKKLAEEQNENKKLAEKQNKNKKLAEEQNENQTLTEEQNENKKLAEEQNENQTLTEEQNENQISTEEQDESPSLIEEQHAIQELIKKPIDSQKLTERQSEKNQLNEEKIEKKQSTIERTEKQQLIKKKNEKQNEPQRMSNMKLSRKRDEEEQLRKKQNNKQENETDEFENANEQYRLSVVDNYSNTFGIDRGCQYNASTEASSQCNELDLCTERASFIVNYQCKEQTNEIVSDSSQKARKSSSNFEAHPDQEIERQRRLISKLDEDIFANIESWDKLRNAITKLTNSVEENSALINKNERFFYNKVLTPVLSVNSPTTSKNSHELPSHANSSVHFLIETPNESKPKENIALINKTEHVPCEKVLPSMLSVSSSIASHNDHELTSNANSSVHFLFETQKEPKPSICSYWNNEESTENKIDEPKLIDNSKRIPPKKLSSDVHKEALHLTYNPDTSPRKMIDAILNNVSSINIFRSSKNNSSEDENKTLSGVKSPKKRLTIQEENVIYPFSPQEEPRKCSILKESMDNKEPELSLDPDNYEEDFYIPPDNNPMKTTYSSVGNNLRCNDQSVQKPETKEIDTQTTRISSEYHEYSGQFILENLHSIQLYNKIGQAVVSGADSKKPPQCINIPERGVSFSMPAETSFSDGFSRYPYYNLNYDNSSIAASLSEGEISIPCKCSTSLGEIHKCRFVPNKEMVKLESRPSSRSVLQKELHSKNLKVNRRNEHNKNWVSYYVSTSSSTDSSEQDEIDGTTTPELSEGQINIYK